MSLKIYNNLTRKKETFEPLQSGKVRMYVCGITAYDECHVGHARAAVVFDVVYRYLKHLKYDVAYVRNFTDVDDKIIKKSQEQGLSCTEITEKYIRSYHEHMERLGVLPPTQEPKATEHIQEMIQLIEQLIKNGYAYPSGANVFFEVRKFKNYGKLSHKKIDELESGARVDVDEKKKDPLDFALWKAAKPGEPKWPSPWGEGRPGWHIECSAMSMKYLGERFDIHGGGRDLIFPHHENEMAQSEAGSGKSPFARFWIHNGFVNINAEKMSKSLGNIRAIPTILEKWDPEVVRYFLLSAHYASPLDFTDDALINAEEALDRFYQCLARLEEAPTGAGTFSFPVKDWIEESLNDDFNTVPLIGRIFELVRQINKVLDQDKGVHPTSRKNLLEGIKLISSLIGVFDSEPRKFLEKQNRKRLKTSQIQEADVLSLIQQRKQARIDKDFRRADEIRQELSSKGVILKDNPDGTTVWEIKS